MLDSSNTPNPRNALKRLLIVLAIVIGFVIYSYGWTVTDIDLEVPQQGQRQENLESALQQLLSPNIFEQDREVINIYANFLVGCEEGRTVEQPAEQYEGAIVEITPDCGDAGDIVAINVTGFEPLAEGRIRWDPPGEDAQTRPREIIEIEREDFVFDDNGNFQGSIEVPRVRGTEGDISQITIRAAVPVGEVHFSETTILVIERMIETIFMALVATTVAIPIATLISFFAARNLMQPIRLSIGSALINFIALAVGLALGSILLKPVADFGVRTGDATDSIALIPFGALALVIGSLYLLSRLTIKNDDDQSDSIVAKVQLVIVRFIYALGFTFLVGLIGGLGIYGGDIFALVSERVTLWGFPLPAAGVLAVGNFLRILGEIIELFTPFVGAIIGGFALTSIVDGTLAPPLRRVNETVGTVLGGILGLFAGTILFWFVAQFGNAAALLGLLSPIVAAIIGGNILMLGYHKFLMPKGPAYLRTNTQKTIKMVLFIIGAVGTFYVTFTYLNIGRALVDGTVPPAITRPFLGMDFSSYVLDNMLVGAILGVVACAIAGSHSSLPIGSILYNVSRTTLNTVRSIEPLIMGLVFVIWVGIGPFAGVLALTLHSIAALGKLYSEQVENIDDGPVEALDSTGATRLQTIIHAVVPQIIPPYIAFTMYRWDINVRMSTIIGFVGGGGIGLLLQQQINLLRYQDAGVAVLAIALVVSILDYASATIRSRIT